MAIRYDTLANRARRHLMDDLKISENDASAVINRMTNVELVELLSFILEQMEV